MFIVVIAVLVFQTLTQKGPIIFYNLSQQATGEYDGWFMAEHYADWMGHADLNNLVDEANYLNFT